MVDNPTTDSTPPAGGASGKKASTKITQFIKKNKTLTVVVGAGAAYFLWKSTSGGGEEYASAEENPEGNVGPLAESEVERDGHAGIDEEIADVREEIDDVREEQREQEEEGSGEHIEEPEKEPSEQPGEQIGSEGTGPTTETTPAAGGITIHGKTFKGATSSRIANTGESEANKPWIEYAITYPGRQEHWRYFTKSGNWSEVKNSATGGGANKPNPGGNGSGNTGGGGGSAGGGGSGQANPPANNANHPDAVNTGNQCVNGGVGQHTAPKGYHLFCENGWIWRAPDKVAVSPGKVVTPAPKPNPTPAPAPAPAPPQCPAGTVANIQQNRNEVNRLQAEINDLTNAINTHPNAKERQGWINNRAGKQAARDAAQGAVDRGRQQPGCGNA